MMSPLKEYVIEIKNIRKEIKYIRNGRKEYLQYMKELMKNEIGKLKAKIDHLETDKKHNLIMTGISLNEENEMNMKSDIQDFMNLELQAEAIKTLRNKQHLVEMETLKYKIHIPT